MRTCQYNNPSPRPRTKSTLTKIMPTYFHQRTLARTLVSLFTLFGLLWPYHTGSAHGDASVKTASSQQFAVLEPVYDTYISDFASTTNHSNEAELRLLAQSDVAVFTQNILLQFDLDELPAGASIQHAELRLYQQAADGNLPIAIDRIMEAWEGATVAWSNPWDNGPNTQNHYAPAIASLDEETYISWDISELAQGWQDRPDLFPNYGLMLAFGSGQEFQSERVFDSSRAENPPQLRVLYTPPEIDIPGNAPAQRLDPNCAVNNERYKEGSAYTFADLSGLSGQVYLIHDDEYLYICAAGQGESQRLFAVYIDTARTDAPPTLPAEEHISLRITVADGEQSVWRGTGTGNPDIPYEPVDPAEYRGWVAESLAPQNSTGEIGAEYQIPLALLGEQARCGASFGLAVYHQFERGAAYGWPRQESPDNPATWVTARLQDASCIRVLCAEDAAPCTPAQDVQVFDADTGAAYNVDALGYVTQRSDINDGARIWARRPITSAANLPYHVYHTSGEPQVVSPEAFAAEPVGEMTLFVGPDHPLMTYDIDVSSQWRIEDDPDYAEWLEANLIAASAYLYRYSHAQIALGEVTIRQDWDGWEEADLRLHAHGNMRPDATLGGVNQMPVPDPDNDQLPPEIEGEIIYWPGIIRIGSSWNRYNQPEPQGGFPVDVSEDWAMVLGHEFGHYLLYLRDTYFRIGRNNTIINVYSCVGSAMGWVYFPENHGFVVDPDHWEENCRDTYGNDLLNRSEWATLSRFFPWLQPPALEAELSSASLPTGITSVELLPASGASPGTPNQPIDLLYQDEEAASNEARAFLFRNERILDQGGPAQDTTHLHLTGSQVGDRLCLIDIDVAPPRPNSPRHQFGCDTLEPGDNELTLRKETRWAPTIYVTPVTTMTLDIEIVQPTDVPLVARLYPEDAAGWIEAALQPVEDQSDTLTGTFQFTQPATSAFVQIFADEPDEPDFPRREAIIDYGANGGGLPGPTSSFGHAPVISSSDGRAVFLLTEGVTLAAGEFIAWQSMIGRPPVPPTLEPASPPYRLIAMPPELVDAGVVSIRTPGPIPAGASTQATRSTPELAPPGTTLHFWDGNTWHALETEFVEDPNGDVIASAPSRGVGTYAIFTARPPSLYIPFTQR